MKAVFSHLNIQQVFVDVHYVYQELERSWGLKSEQDAVITEFRWLVHPPANEAKDTGRCKLESLTLTLPNQLLGLTDVGIPRPDRTAGVESILEFRSAFEIRSPHCASFVLMHINVRVWDEINRVRQFPFIATGCVEKDHSRQIKQLVKEALG